MQLDLQLLKLFAWRYLIIGREISHSSGTHGFPTDFVLPSSTGDQMFSRPHSCSILDNKNKTHKTWILFLLCRERESNSHGLLRTILSRVRLPIPPSRLSLTSTTYNK